MKLLVPVLAAAVGIAPAVPAQATQAPGEAPRQAIAWHGCQLGPGDQLGKQLDQAGADCGEVTVPLDYGRPDGRTLTVAMSRLKASDTTHRLGVMLLNGGGPGGMGLDMPLAVQPGMKEVGRRYDLIGMDPRFVGRSTPLDCGWPVGHWARSAGADRRSFDHGVRFVAGLARRCATHAADVLPYATTRNTARDMDVIRDALGADKLSYLGYSYGTYLGAVYLQMFPHRAGRVVLDSAVDPADFGPRLLRDTGPANEAALRGWAGWAARRHSTYGLGRTPDQVLGTVQRIYRAARRQPLRIGRYAVDEHVVPMLFFSPIADDQEETNAALASDTRLLRQAATTGERVEPTPHLEEFLRFLLTGADSKDGSAQIAILCGDRSAPRRPAIYWSDIQRHRKAEPFFGALTRNITPCSFWQQPPQEQPTRVANGVPALIVQATGDPRTIYPNGVKMHRALTGSRLLTLRDARRHAVYAWYGNDCVDGHVNEYLAGGALPAEDLTCQNSSGR